MAFPAPASWAGVILPMVPENARGGNPKFGALAAWSN
jgi:hypothetical protein